MIAVVHSLRAFMFSFEEVLVSVPSRFSGWIIRVWMCR